MFEKILVTTLKSISAVIYVLIMLMLLAFPVSFIVHAFLPPVFVLDNISITEISENDTMLDKNENRSDWVKIEYSLTASSGKFSPYFYKIEELQPENIDDFPAIQDYKIAIDEVSCFSADEFDDLLVSLYVKAGDTVDIESISENVSFKTKVYEKGFGSFSVKYEN